MLASVVEVLLVFFISQFAGILLGLGAAGVFLMTLYILSKKVVFKQSWQDLGFKTAGFLQDLASSWHLILFTGIILQILVVYGSQLLYTPLHDKLLSRAQVIISSFEPPDPVTIFTAFSIIVILEEMIFRGFVQNELSKHLRVRVAVIVQALLVLEIWILFNVGGVREYQNSATFISDLVIIGLENVLYGAVFHRTKSILISWFPHMLVNLVGLILLLPSITV